MTMDAAGVVSILEEMASLLELSGNASPFEIMAYKNGARAVEDFEGDLRSTVESNRLSEIPGIGKRLTAVIGQLVIHGRSDLHQEMRGEYPETLFDLFGVRGLGAKKIGRLYRELGVQSLDSLSRAAKEERIRDLKGFGVKSEARILVAIESTLRYGRDFAAPVPEILPAERSTATGAVEIGTSGYSYPEWKGAFFPDDITPEHFLEFYSQCFSTVEVNNTFYRFPTARMFEEWLTIVPENFTFAVKANLRITHRHRLLNVAEITTSFLRRCQVLGPHLGPVLFQLPPDFVRDDDRLDCFLTLLPPTIRCAMEFRHSTWHDDVVYEKLKSANVAFVLSDEQSLPPPRVVTSDFTYIRFRNDDYGRGEIEDWREWILETAASGSDVFGYLKHKKDGTSPEPVIRLLDAR